MKITASRLVRVLLIGVEQIGGCSDSVWFSIVSVQSWSMLLNVHDEQVPHMQHCMPQPSESEEFLKLQWICDPILSGALEELSRQEVDVPAWGSDESVSLGLGYLV